MAAENTHLPATNLTPVTRERFLAGSSSGSDALWFENELSDAEVIHLFCKTFAEPGPACFR